MELNIYDVIKGVIQTSKSIFLQKKHGHITFKVNVHANKIIVRYAVEKIWNVKVKDVRIINIKGKKRMVGRRVVQRPGIKKAIVALRKGYTIDLPQQFESMGLSQTQKSNKEKT